jgi:PPOX class probable F420-dependent enzyme
VPPTPEQEQLITEHNLALLATLRKDGSPQITPVNYVYRDGRFLISTTRDRAKYHNVRRNAAVSLCVIRPEGRPYVTVFGQARVEEDDVAEGTAEIFRSISGRPLPENFGEALRQQRRILIIVTPERFVP